VLHLWHPEADRSQLPDNERRLDDVIKSDRVKAERGLSSLGASPRQGSGARAIAETGARSK
jgi:hypothetical protein